MNRYKKSEFYPNMIFDKEEGQYLTITEVVRRLNHDYPPIEVPCKECKSECVTCDVPYCFINYNK